MPLINRCPFCRSDNVVLDQRNKTYKRKDKSRGQASHFVRCRACYARGPLCATKWDALSAWCRPTSLEDKLAALPKERQDRIKAEADRLAALDELARLGQEYDAETEAGGSIIQGLREAAKVVGERLRAMPTYSGEPKSPHWVPDNAVDLITALLARIADDAARIMELEAEVDCASKEWIMHMKQAAKEQARANVEQGIAAAAEAEVMRLRTERDQAREQARANSFAGEGYVYMQQRAEAAEARIAALEAQVARMQGALTNLPAVYAHQINTGVREVYDPLQRFYTMESVLAAITQKDRTDD